MCSIVNDDFAMMLLTIILRYRNALGMQTRLIDSSFIDHVIVVKALPIDKWAPKGAPS